jgi:hypothetical protein
MLNIPAEYDTRYFTTKINGQFSPTFSLLHNCVSAGIYQRALAEESGMIRTQMEMHNRSENGRSAQDTLYDTTSYQ